MLYLATDHAGFELMQNVVEFLKKSKIDFTLVGANTYDSKDSYVEYTKIASKLVSESSDNFGVFICGTGIGTSIVANRFPKIRAALCHNSEFAKMSRLHNNANVLVLPGRYVTISEAEEIISVFLSTKFEGGRHLERINMID